MKHKQIFESPDEILYKDIAAGPWESQAYAFGMVDYKMYISDQAQTHYNIFDEEEMEELKKKLGQYTSRLVFTYPGRIWLNDKIISFWFYPTTNEVLHNIILKLEDVLSKKLNKSITIWNDKEFQIEIIIDKKNSLVNKSSSYGDWAPSYDKIKKLIPLKLFKSLANVSKEELIKNHIQSDKKKVVPSGYGSKFYKGDSNAEKRNQWRAAKPFESYYPELTDKIFENPNATIDPTDWEKHKDNPSYTPKSIEYDNEDAGPIVFSYDIKGNIITSDEIGHAHSDLHNTHTINGRTKNSGRIFSTLKVITFWSFPQSYDELMKVLKDLEQATKLNIINDKEWRIEIPSGEFTKYFNDPNPRGWGTWQPRVGDVSFIKIEDYRGGYQRSKEELNTPHLDSSKKKVVPSGYGSKFYKGDSTANTRNQWRAAKPFESYYPLLK